MAKTILQIPGSERFFSDGSRPDPSAISPKLKLFQSDPSLEIDATTHAGGAGGINSGPGAGEPEEAFAEGMTYPRIKIVEGGETRRDVEDVYLRRSRAPALVGLDLRAHIASNNVAKQRIHELVDR